MPPTLVTLLLALCSPCCLHALFTICHTPFRTTRDSPEDEHAGCDQRVGHEGADGHHVHKSLQVEQECHHSYRETDGKGKTKRVWGHFLQLLTHSGTADWYSFCLQRHKRVSGLYKLPTLRLKAPSSLGNIKYTCYDYLKHTIRQNTVFWGLGR